MKVSGLGFCGGGGVMIGSTNGVAEREREA